MIIFELILATSSIFEAAGAGVEIGWSLNITNFNQVKIVQIPDTSCSFKVILLATKSLLYREYSRISRPAYVKVEVNF